MCLKYTERFPELRRNLNVPDKKCSQVVHYIIHHILSLSSIFSVYFCHSCDMKSTVCLVTMSHAVLPEAHSEQQWCQVVLNTPGSPPPLEVSQNKTFSWSEIQAKRQTSVSNDLIIIKLGLILVMWGSQRPSKVNFKCCNSAILQHKMLKWIISE